MDQIRSFVRDCLSNGETLPLPSAAIVAEDCTTALPAGVKVWLASGATDMRNGFDGLAAQMDCVYSQRVWSVGASS
jgi:hypothetical protein